tara:strand:+ start:27882 stop:29651 length:1770 start_codon:yes stop_codon:yes gene_type:complete
MIDLHNIPPGLILIFGALLVPFLPGKLKNICTIILPLIAFSLIAKLPLHVPTCSWNLFPGLPAVEWLRVDKLSKAFGYIFTINAVAAFIFAFYLRKSTQHVAALIYIGGALGTVFAGDLVSAYVNWEIMAIASTFVILANPTAKAKGAALRYAYLHIFGGLLFLAGLILTIGSTGSIAFDGFKPQEADLGSWLILAGFLVNAAAPPLHAWLSDAYPEASISGGVILSAYTTKTAVYTLLRGYPGWEILVWIGCIMTVYGVIYALLENDIRRVWAYSIISQVGFMVCAAGIGTHEAISGATAHAFCHIIYKSLLWMSAGAIIYRVGKSKYTELGGLYKSMPWTATWAIIGALAMSAVPLTSGFTSKSIIIHATEHEAHLLWAWYVLEIASAGSFFYAGIRFPYYIIFGKDAGHRPKEAPFSMHLAMGVLAFLCIFLGCYPKPLYDILPHSIGEYSAYGHVLSQLQLLAFAALAFFVLKPFLKQTDTISLDTDWFWRKGGRGFYWLMDRTLNGFNKFAHIAFVGVLIPLIDRLVNLLPSSLASGLLGAVVDLEGDPKTRRAALEKMTRKGALPIGVTACFGVFALALLLLF